LRRGRGGPAWRRKVAKLAAAAEEAEAARRGEGGGRATATLAST
jgi:hypothetical protein